MKNNYKKSLLICICVLIITTHAQFRERERQSGSFLGSFINRIRSREPSRAAMERVLLSVQRYQSLGLTLGELRRRNRFVDYVMRAIEERNKNDPFNPGMYSIHVQLMHFFSNNIGNCQLKKVMSCQPEKVNDVNLGFA